MWRDIMTRDTIFIERCSASVLNTSRLDEKMLSMRDICVFNNTFVEVQKCKRLRASLSRTRSGVDRVRNLELNRIGGVGVWRI